MKVWCILIMLCNHLIIESFSQDIDPDTFDFDNFDAYMTTEKFEYSTLDPLSFFPSVEPETELPVEEAETETEKPSDNVEDERVTDTVSPDSSHKDATTLEPTAEEGTTDSSKVDAVISTNEPTINVKTSTEKNFRATSELTPTMQTSTLSISTSQILRTTPQNLEILTSTDLTPTSTVGKLDIPATQAVLLTTTNLPKRVDETTTLVIDSTTQLITTTTASANNASAIDQSSTKSTLSEEPSTTAVPLLTLEPTNSQEQTTTTVSSTTPLHEEPIKTSAPSTTAAAASPPSGIGPTESLESLTTSVSIISMSTEGPSETQAPPPTTVTATPWFSEGSTEPEEPSTTTASQIPQSTEGRREPEKISITSTIPTTNLRPAKPQELSTTTVSTYPESSEGPIELEVPSTVTAVAMPPSSIWSTELSTTILSTDPEGSPTTEATIPTTSVGPNKPQMLPTTTISTNPESSEEPTQPEEPSTTTATIPTTSVEPTKPREPSTTTFSTLPQSSEGPTHSEELSTRSAITTPPSSVRPTPQDLLTSISTTTTTPTPTPTTTSTTTTTTSKSQLAVESRKFDEQSTTAASNILQSTDETTLLFQTELSNDLEITSTENPNESRTPIEVDTSLDKPAATTGTTFKKTTLLPEKNEDTSTMQTMMKKLESTSPNTATPSIDNLSPAVTEATTESIKTTRKPFKITTRMPITTTAVISTSKSTLNDSFETVSSTTQETPTTFTSTEHFDASSTSSFTTMQPNSTTALYIVVTAPPIPTSSITPAFSTTTLKNPSRPSTPTAVPNILTTTTAKSSTLPVVGKDFPKLEPRFLFPIDEIPEPIQLTSPKSILGNIDESLRTTTKRPKQIFHPNLEKTNPVELTTKATIFDIDEESYPTFNPNFMIRINESEESVEITTKKIDSSFTMKPFRFFNEFFKVPAENPKRPIVEPTRPYHKQDDGLREYKFNPFLRKHIEEPEEAVTKETSIFRLDPKLMKPIPDEEKPTLTPRYYIKVLDPRCQCMRRVINPNPVIQRDHNLSKEREWLRPESRPTIWPSSNKPHGNVFRINIPSQDSTQKVSLDNIEKIFKPIPIPEEILSAFPNFKSEDTPKAVNPNYYHSVPNQPGGFRIVPQGEMKIVAPTIQSPTQFVYKYNSGPQTPTMVKIQEPERPLHFYYKHSPDIDKSQFFVPNAGARQHYPQGTIKLIQPRPVPAQETQTGHNFGYPIQSPGHGCHYKAEEGPLTMDGDPLFGRLLIAPNRCKRCFYCCPAPNGHLNCDRVKLFECHKRQLLALPGRPTQQYQEPSQPSTGSCKLTKTWTDGMMAPPKYKVICS